MTASTDVGRALSTACVAGVDEAGRGPLAGPLVCAAVILHPDRPISGLRDSKQLSAARRESLRQRILQDAQAYCIIEIAPAEIDELNIYQATMAGMRRAVLGLKPAPTLALLDGNATPKDMPCATQAIVKGDQLHACISAASILAKTTRDAIMSAMHERWPQYGFAGHKGYPTKFHLAALKQFGVCGIHRLSYAPVRESLIKQGELF